MNKLGYLFILFFPLTIGLIFASCGVINTTTKYKVTIIAVPSNGGTVSPTSGKYKSGKELQISATLADSSWKFDHWSGDFEGASSSATIVVNRDKHIIAHFVNKKSPLTINTKGMGTVKQKIIQNKALMAKNYNYGALVQLIAKPVKGWKFVKWTGDLTSSKNPAEIKVKGPKKVTVVFERKSKPSNPTINGPKVGRGIRRGLVAINVEGGVFLSWRLYVTDSTDIGFNLYRNGEKVNSKPIASSTNYLDSAGTTSDNYYVQPVINEEKQHKSVTVNVWGHNYISVPIQKPTGGITPDGVDYTYSANDASAGDLDGDGQYEIVLKWSPSNQKDPSQDGYTGDVYLDGYKLDGTRLWQIDLGKNIRAGAHTTPFLVYDFDGDGKAEIVVRISDGAVDGPGQVIGDPNADYRNSKGRILTGPEYLAVFGGESGKLITKIAYSPDRGNVCNWGDCYGNRVDRFLAGVAYLDGVSPSIVEARGYYAKTALTAYRFRGGKLIKTYSFDTSAKPSYKKYEDQGDHSVAVADVDGDGKDEIIYGADVFDNNLNPLYTTGLGHGDALHVGDLDPTKPGLEVFNIHENTDAKYGYELHGARTGKIYWGSFVGGDAGRGMAADIDPRYKGAEYWSYHSPLYNSDGKQIAPTQPSSDNFGIWWNGDLNRELLNGTTISKFDYKDDRTVKLFTCQTCHSNNGSKANPTLQADIFGDWREEVVWPTKNNSALRIYTTTDLTKNRIFTLMQDPVYREAIAWQNVGYNQPPHASFYLGVGMTMPASPYNGKGVQ